jgi:hypothetical protein
MQQDLAAVRGVRLALDETGRFQPIYQFDRGVMSQGETIRQLANGRLGTIGQAFQRQQRLVLLRLDAMLSGLYLAELKEMPELVPELSQLLIFAQT